jgi:hypothetical protein
MGQVIPLGSRQAIKRNRPPSGKSAEILRTIGGEAKPPNPLKSYYITRKINGRTVRLDGPFNTHQAAMKEMRDYKATSSDPDSFDIEYGD